VIDLRDPFGEATNQAKQLFEVRFRKDIIDLNLPEGAADAIHTTRPLNEPDGIPVQIIIDDHPGILQIGVLGPHGPNTPYSMLPLFDQCQHR